MLGAVDHRAQLEHVVINDVSGGTFFARILLRMENELGKKIVEVDARPSDSIVLALQHRRPLFVARKVLDSVEDMTEILERVLKQQADEAAKSEENKEDEPKSDDDEEEKP